MKGYDEIRRIMVEDLGFHDLAAYQSWIEHKRPNVRPTAEAIARLSPDVVDCRAFWKVCDDLFGIDPVCNLAMAPEVGKLPYPIVNATEDNRLNLRLAKCLGITAFLPHRRSLRHRARVHDELATACAATPRPPGCPGITPRGAPE